MRPTTSPLTRTIFCILLATPMVFISCGSEDDESAENAQVERREVLREVTFGTVDEEPLQVFIASQGIVEASREQVISTRVSGYVEETNISDGRFVAAGDTVLSSREDEFLLDMREAENNLGQARYEYETDYASVLATEGRTEEQNRLLRMYTGLEQAEIAYERAQQEFENIHVTVPFSGYLAVEEQAVPGGYLGSGTEVARLLDDRTVQVRFDVLEAEVNVLEPGMEVIVTSPTGVRLTGRISSVSPVVDPESKTGQIRAEIPNPDRILKTGMTVGGRINIRTYTGGIRMARSAVLERDGGRMLFFRLSRDEQNEPFVEWVYIEPEDLIGITTEYAMVSPEIASATDTVAVDRHFSLSHLQPVTPRMEGTIPLEEQGMQ